MAELILKINSVHDGIVQVEELLLLRPAADELLRLIFEQLFHALAQGWRSHFLEVLLGTHCQVVFDYHRTLQLFSLEFAPQVTAELLSNVFAAQDRLLFEAACGRYVASEVMSSNLVEIHCVAHASLERGFPLPSIDLLELLCLCYDGLALQHL